MKLILGGGTKLYGDNNYTTPYYIKGQKIWVHVVLDNLNIDYFAIANISLIS